MDQRYDIIVIGAGTAGMALTSFAAPRGARILVVEQHTDIGGTLHYSSGQMSGAGTRLQAKRGIKDHPDVHYADIMRISRDRADPALTRLATNIAADTIDWLTGIETEFAPECPTIHYGHEPYSVARTHWGADSAKSYLKVMRPLFERVVRENDVTVLMATRMTDLLRDDQGSVVGVEIEGGGQKRKVFSKNVVLATGGYGSNPALFRHLTGDRPLYTMAAPTSTGSGIEAAVRCGAVVRGQEDFLPTFGGTTAADDNLRIDSFWGMEFTPQTRKPWEIFVNTSGDRFVAEDSASVDHKEHALLAQPDLTFWVLFDERVYRDAPWIFRRCTRADAERAFDGGHDSFKKANTIAALAAACGMEPERLQNTVAAYNRAQEGGCDPLGRNYMPSSLTEAPFYAVRNHGVVVRTFAGLRINDSLEVLDVEGKPIPNLYAAGEIVGASTFAGQSFAGGMSITPALGFGRILGERLLRW